MPGAPGEVHGVSSSIASVQPLRERLKNIADRLGEVANVLHGVEIALVGVQPARGTDLDNVSASQGEVHDQLATIEALAIGLELQAGAISKRV